MTRSMRGQALVVLALTAAYVGGWAALAPRSFYDSFPGLGRHWVSVDGAFNEHLVRDVGGLYLALLVLTVFARVRLEPTLVRVTGLAWLVFGVPHLAYHATHLEDLATSDAALNVVALGVLVVLAALLCLPPRPDPQPH